ncbi:uncharacterized protein LOC110461823 [Mizuhopecten yessoensis]|uniref:RING finger protein nhl-1 n=1 Tax=Mizuhopecten yessoensis TaxID=6573 RepID=A0A210PZS5_MIZYE|nr:uncharacterized protein LOC110461823 [Mizuhopecten yessoensis]OWF41909.1 RING finger protein nhl-1 [Mizuhopecten yessoensis]
MTSNGLSKRREDATENDEACTICTEVYRDPRLLPCRHTFCSCCLERWHASSRQRHYFSCPICREEVWLPEHGVQGFSSNYFVPCKLYKENCSVCQTSSVDVRRCNSCDQLLCQTCRTTHESHQASKDGSCCRDQEDEVVPGEATAIRTAISMLRPVTRSCCYAEVIGGFQSTFTCVSKIVPVSARDAWVLFDNGPAIYRYNMSGKVTDTRYAAGKVIDMCAHPDGPLLVIQEYSNSVFVCGDLNTTPIEYVNVGDYLPTSLLVRDDGSLIVAVKPLNDSLLNECVLLEYDHERNQRRSRTLRGQFMRISGLAFDTYSSQVCTADMECRVVHVLPNDTVRALTYCRSAAFPIRRESDGLMTTQFTPRAVCSGLHDAFLVLDGGSGYIHVLDALANLISVVVMDDQEHASSPNTIAVGRDDRLWVGDASDGKVKVYSLNSFINHLQQEPIERGFTFDGIRLPGTDELRGTSSGVSEHFPKYDSAFTRQRVLALGLDGNTLDMSKEAFDDMARNCLPAIRITTDFNGITITLDDTGTPEGNIRERERVLCMIRQNDLIRNQIEQIGHNAYHLGPDNFKFESITNVQPQRFSSTPNQSGSFSMTPFTAGSFPLQYGSILPNLLTGNREYDMQLFIQFLQKHPAIREDMERKGITPRMILDFPYFLKEQHM